MNSSTEKNDANKNRTVVEPEIAEDEVLLRLVFYPFGYGRTKKKKPYKLLWSVFEPPHVKDSDSDSGELALSNELSVNRCSYTNFELCQKQGREREESSNNKYIGVLAVMLNDFRERTEQWLREVRVIYTPKDDNEPRQTIIRRPVYCDEPGNPAHADLIINVPAVKKEGSAKFKVDPIAKNILQELADQLTAAGRFLKQEDIDDPDCDTTLDCIGARL